MRALGQEAFVGGAAESRGLTTSLTGGHVELKDIVFLELIEHGKMQKRHRERDHVFLDWFLFYLSTPGWL